MAQNLAVDVGGTFTDLVIFDQDSGQLAIDKVLSTPEDPSEGVMEGIRQSTEKSGSTIADIELLFHGTTVVANLLLEETGARVGLLITEGFKQTLHLARAWTPGPLYGWIGMDKPPPLADLIDTREIEERIDASGEVVSELNEDQVKQAVDELVDNGIEALTVAFINSYTNNDHEVRVREIVEESYPDLPVTLSSSIVPEYGEYQRTLTSVMNSYGQPEVTDYLSRLEDSLDDDGFNGTLNIVRSDGGTMSSEMASKRPVDIAFSGPSGGVRGASYLADKVGVSNVLTIDMGGTSTDVSLVYEGRSSVKRQVKVGYREFKARSVDINSVGAGGGSIAHVAITGALKIGPQSAGADPGPACYGFGGEQPTVTDANVVLHRIPTNITKLGGDLELDEDAAREAVSSIAEEMNLSLEESAQAILDIANENMLGALRVVSVERGYDPREFGLVAFGGAGPMHANALARLIQASPVIIPPTPGVMSSFGFLSADIQNEFTKMYLKLKDESSPEDLQKKFDALIDEAEEWLDSEKVPESLRDYLLFADCRYYRQDIQIPCELTLGELKEKDPLQLLRNRFESQHEQQYGFTLDSPFEIASLRLIGKGEIKGLELEAKTLQDEDAYHALLEEVDCYFDGAWTSTPVYDREQLNPGNIVKGPAIVVQNDTTVVVEPDYHGRVDEFENILIEEA